MSRRSRARRTAEAALRAIHAALPKLECKGLCERSCGPIAFSELELRQMQEAHGGPLPPRIDDHGVVIRRGCPLLEDGRCTIYRARPMVCRLFGMVDDDLMRCPHGCRPHPRYLTAREGHALIGRVEQISRRFEEESDGKVP